jgi:hypothetical protein
MIGRLLGGAGVVGAAMLGAAKLILRSRAEPQDDEIDLAAVMENRRFSTRADPFLGGTVMVLAAGAELDLSASNPAPTGIELAVAVIAGRLRLVVDPAWNVQTEVAGRIARVRDRNQLSDDDAPWVRIAGNVWLGSMEVVAAPAVRRSSGRSPNEQARDGY